VTKAFRVLSDDHEGKDRLNMVCHITVCYRQCTGCSQLLRPFLQMIGRLQTAWSTVCHDHEYIAPTWPATVTSAGYVVPAITTPYYRNGNVLQYVRRNPNVDRLDIVFQAACALAYIHSKGVIHGNVCPVRLASDQPCLRPRLC
jgi:serine/threonine protein kinase